MPETPRQPDERELDALLDDVKQLLGEEPESKPAIARRHSAGS